jgi:hypothetical protein
MPITLSGRRVCEPIRPMEIDDVLVLSIALGAQMPSSLRKT